MSFLESCSRPPPTLKTCNTLSQDSKSPRQQAGKGEARNSSCIKNPGLEPGGTGRGTPAFRRRAFQTSLRLRTPCRVTLEKTGGRRPPGRFRSFETRGASSHRARVLVKKPISSSRGWGVKASRFGARSFTQPGPSAHTSGSFHSRRQGAHPPTTGDRRSCQAVPIDPSQRKRRPQCVPVRSSAGENMWL